MKNLKENKIRFENAMVLAMADQIKVANYDPNKLWEIVCNMFSIDYDNEELGNMFDGIWENFYIKTDILSLGAEKVSEMAVELLKNKS